MADERAARFRIQVTGFCERGVKSSKRGVK
jgi:hypothetical protein